MTVPVVRGDYNSGQDYRLEYGDLHFSFNERDFHERVEQAARQLKLIDGHLTEPEIEDLVELVLEGYPPEHSRSDMGEHLHQIWPSLLLVTPGPAHWLRRLVFRHAWCDQRVIEGEIDVRYRDGQLVYVDPRRRDEPVDLAACPDYTSIAYKP